MTKHTRIAALATTVSALVATALPPAAGAAPPEVHAYGDYFNDGLDSRLAAYEVGKAAERSGYTRLGSLSGQRAFTVWDKTRYAQIFANFGHSDAGLFQTDEGPTDAQDEIVFAGERTDVFSSGTHAYWNEYVPNVDSVDDVRLAILAGCQTAGTHPRWGNLLSLGRELGMDSLIGFAELVYFPADCGTVGCDYSGNYFWHRFAVYTEAGDTIRVALGKAEADLVTSEGSAQGWELWRIRGALADPGSVRITPAGGGTLGNYKPFGIEPFDPSELVDLDSQPVEVAGNQYTDSTTAEGVSLRRDQAGDLVWLAAPIAATGPVNLTEAQALTTAEQFARENVNWFAGDDMTLTSTRSVDHVDGDELQRISWRSTVAGRPGPALVTVEVDRRTASVVSLVAARPDAGASDVPVTRAEAVSAAREVAGERGNVTEAFSEVWDRGRWVIAIDRGSNGRFRDVVRVIVDGRTGRVVSMAKT